MDYHQKYIVAKKYYIHLQLINNARELIGGDNNIDSNKIIHNSGPSGAGKSTLGNKLKEHQRLYKQVWTQHNIEKYNNIMLKTKNLDDILYQNF